MPVKSLLLRLALPALIIGGAWFGMQGFLKSPPQEETAERSRRSNDRVAQKAEVMPLIRRDYPITIQTQGTVRAHNETRLTARTNGRVQRVHSSFEPGAFFQRGDILLELDPTDSEASIISAEAQVARAQATLLQEEARSRQAELNWKELGYSEKPNDLVLRIPQLRQAEAALKSAEANLAEAQRDKLHTQVIAPFDGCVRERLVGPGQTISPNTPLGTIFATDYAEVRLPISPKDLPFTPFQNQAILDNQPALIRDGLASSPETAAQWEAELVRTEGIIDESSRELFLVARIPDPYGLKNKKTTPLRVGQPVRAEIAGNTLNGVYVIPRSSLRGPFEAVLVNNETLEIQRQKIQALWTDEDNLIIDHPLPENHSLVTSRLAFAANGSVIEIIPPQVEAVHTAQQALKDA